VIFTSEKPEAKIDRLTGVPGVGRTTVLACSTPSKLELHIVKVNVPVRSVNPD
jgi:adenylate kinase